MNNTLQLISIQHELGMAIGMDLRLKPMLQQFFKVCIRRLGLAGVHIYTLMDESGEPTSDDNANGTAISHYLSIPDGCEGTDLDDMVRARFHEEQYVDGSCITYQERNNAHIYYFKLDGVGIVVFRSLTHPLDKQVTMLIKPIFSRLNMSCRASIAHEKLLAEIAARQKAEQTVLHQLLHDDLTGLPNRRLFMQYLDQEIFRCNRHNMIGAVMYIDLDRFKAVNDTLGHAAGDLLLRRVSSILSEITRREDTVARLSGDEFAILLTQLGDDAEAALRNTQAIVDNIFMEFAKPLSIGEHSFYITPSIGINIFPDEKRNADEILRHADTAMYQAKSSGRNTSAVYDRKMSDELQSRMNIEKALRNAIKNEEFTVYYQPQYLYPDLIIGAEALLRWKNPTLGSVSPAEFIPIAEETGYILELGDWLLQKTCWDIRRLEKTGLPSTFQRLSINVSAIQFSQTDFVEKLRRVVSQTFIDSAHLGIEITESTLISNIDDIVAKMREMRNAGIHVSIDDFGTGYSSLAYLMRFPIDNLKIDQVFVRAIETEQNNRAIIETIMALARNLNLSVIAEGVETNDELECLRGLGCNQFQGYYFGRPQPFDALLELFKKNIATATLAKGSN